MNQDFSPPGALAPCSGQKVITDTVLWNQAGTQKTGQNTETQVYTEKVNPETQVNT